MGHENHESLHLKEEDFLPAVQNQADAEAIERESLSVWQDVWYRLKKNKLAMFGMWVMILLIIMAVVGPMITPHNYYDNNLKLTNQPPSSSYWFGTDDLGRDMFARTWTGAQVSLFVGFAAAFIDLIIGVVYGGIMGYFGGKVDEVMNRITEILYAIPYLLVVIMLLVVFQPGVFTIVLAMSITGWIGMSWIVRGQIMQLKNQEYVLASRSLGAGWRRILFRHLIPNSMGPIIVTLTLTVPSAIFTEAFLSFLGLGVQSPKASWGTMISDAISAMTIYPWRMFFPAFFIFLAMFAFNVFGDGLRDAFDPKMRR